MFGLFEKKKPLTLCKWCPAPNRFKGVPAKLAAGEGHPFSSLCRECNEKAFSYSPDIGAAQDRVMSEYASRLEMLRIRWVTAEKAGSQDVAARIQAERAALLAERDGKLPTQWTPEKEKARSDPALLAEFAAFAKLCRQGTNSVKSLKDTADDGQQEEWELRKQSVAAFKANNFPLGEALQARADEVGKRVNEARRALAGMTDEELFGSGESGPVDK